MSSEVITVIIVVIIIGIFLFWRIPIGRRIKREEQEFIEQHIIDCAILVFYGSVLEIGGWSFYDDGNQCQWTDEFIKHIDKVTSYYGKYTLAIPAGEYDSIVSFDFNYGNGSKLGGTGFTRKLNKRLTLSQGYIYRYRLKDFSVISKKQPYETLFEEDLEASMLNHRTVYTATFERVKY